jgi:hypothetical protein
VSPSRRFELSPSHILARWDSLGPAGVSRTAFRLQPSLAHLLVSSGAPAPTAATPHKTRSTPSYIPSPVVPYPTAALAMVDRRGHVSALAGEVRSYGGAIRLSPDGRRLAVSVVSPTEQALGVIDLARGSFTKLTAEGEGVFPRWTPDGQRIAFKYTRDGVLQLAWQPADGSAGPDTLVQSVEGEIVPSSWSPDGRHLVAVKDRDLWVLTAGDPLSFSPLTATTDGEADPEFSPDGSVYAHAS